MRIRKAIESDIPAMAELWKMLVLEENLEAVPDTKEWGDIQRRMFNLKDYYVYVAEEDGVIVGFNNGLILKDLETGQRYVDGGNFYVLPEYRKGSAGALLHRNSFEVGKAFGAKFLRRKVSANNDRMVRRFMKSKRCILKEYVVDEMIGGRRQ